jgi:hypothetical protein
MNGRSLALAMSTLRTLPSAKAAIAESSDSGMPQAAREQVHGAGRQHRQRLLLALEAGRGGGNGPVTTAGEHHVRLARGRSLLKRRHDAVAFDHVDVEAVPRILQRLAHPLGERVEVGGLQRTAVPVEHRHEMHGILSVPPACSTRPSERKFPNKISHLAENAGAGEVQK